MAPALEIQDLTLRYGRVVAVDGLCLVVPPGVIYGLLGPNGCGKSSTVAAAAGLLAPSSGTVRVAGAARHQDPFGYARCVGLVPQELAVFEELTPEDNLTFFGRLYGLSGGGLRESVNRALDLVRLRCQARRPVRTFPGGMQRRLNLACALLHDPPLLLLDEPTVGLDVPSRDAVFAALRALRDRGRAVVFTTHHLAEAERLCDRVGLMDRGRLVAEGTPDELAEAGDGGPGLERAFLELTGRSPRDP